VPALRESKEAQGKLDSLLIGCFAVQKMYGRAPENIEAINQIFHAILGKFKSDKVLKAFEIWLERNQEFPTPADIVSLINRGGKAPITKEVYISICKKDGEHRTPDEWRLKREYEAEQMEYEFGPEIPDERKLSDVISSNESLRRDLQQARDENKRLAELLLAARVAKGLERPKLTDQERALRTIAEMRRIGAPEEDIELFAIPFGGIFNLEQPKGSA